MEEDSESASDGDADPELDAVFAGARGGASDEDAGAADGGEAGGAAHAAMLRAVGGGAGGAAARRRRRPRDEAVDEAFPEAEFNLPAPGAFASRLFFCRRRRCCCAVFLSFFPGGLCYSPPALPCGRRSTRQPQSRPSLRAGPHTGARAGAPRPLGRGRAPSGARLPWLDTSLLQFL